MHAIVNRPVVRGDQIVARPMMFFFIIILIVKIKLLIFLGIFALHMIIDLLMEEKLQLF